MSFGGLYITNKGKVLQAKAQTGVQLNFTRLAVGDGQLSGQAILELNTLINQIKSITLNKFKTLPAGKAVIGGSLSNQDIQTGFYMRELGVFAQDPNVGEILYCYGNAGALAEYIPAQGGAEILEKQINVVTLVDNVPNVSATIEQSLVYATQQDVAAAENNLKIYLVQNLIGHEDDSTTHGIGDKSTLKTAEKATIVGALNELFTNVSDGKNAVASAITDMGQSAVGSDTFTTLATKIKEISTDASAGVGDALAGKTFYQGGSKKTGTMPDQGQKIYTPGTSNITIPAGYHSGTGYIVGDANFKASNLPKGMTLFGVSGTLTAVQIFAGNDFTYCRFNDVYTTSTTFVKHAEKQVGNIFGTMRLYFKVDTRLKGEIQLQKNGTIIKTFTYPMDGYPVYPSEHQFDFAVAPNDIFTFYVRTTSTTSNAFETASYLYFKITQNLLQSSTGCTGDN